MLGCYLVGLENICNDELGCPCWPSIFQHFWLENPPWNCLSCISTMKKIKGFLAHHLFNSCWRFIPVQPRNAINRFNTPKAVNFWSALVPMVTLHDQKFWTVEGGEVQSPYTVDGPQWSFWMIRDAYLYIYIFDISITKGPHRHLQNLWITIPKVNRFVKSILKFWSFHKSFGIVPSTNPD